MLQKYLKSTLVILFASSLAGVHPASADNEPKQVQIQTKILQVNQNQGQELGFNWGQHENTNELELENSPGADLNLDAISGTNSASRLGTSFGDSFGSTATEFTINALEREGFTRTLAEPKLVTLDGKIATIEYGTRIPLQENSPSGTPSTTVSYPDGFQLTITPMITADGHVRLEINPEVSGEPQTFRAVPDVQTRFVQTNAVIPDGQTFAIAGLLTDNAADDRTQVPWLSKIPIAGWLFKNKSESREKQNLLIFITPRIIKNQ